MLERMTKFSLDRPKTVIGLAIIVTVLFGLQFPRITIDTDPENMLAEIKPTECSIIVSRRTSASTT